MVAFSVRSHAGLLVGSDESYTTSGAVSFSNDGTALRFSGAINYDTGKKKGSEGQRFQSIVSKEQFQKLSQTLADNDFSNLEDSTERISDTMKLYADCYIFGQKQNNNDEQYRQRHRRNKGYFADFLKP